MLGMKLTSFFSYMPNNLWEDSQHCKKGVSSFLVGIRI